VTLQVLHCRFGSPLENLAPLHSKADKKVPLSKTKTKSPSAQNKKKLKIKRYGIPLPKTSIGNNMALWHTINQKRKRS